MCDLIKQYYNANQNSAYFPLFFSGMLVCNRKLLLLSTSTPGFLWFALSCSKCWDGFHLPSWYSNRLAQPSGFKFIKIKPLMQKTIKQSLQIKSLSLLPCFILPYTLLILHPTSLLISRLQYIFYSICWVLYQHLWQCSLQRTSRYIVDITTLLLSDTIQYN
jgi:hypothetical protein